MREISITDIEGIKIGQAQDMAGGTGCTVFIAPDGAAAGVDVRGGGPASRETTLLEPRAAADSINAVLLSGGSAFGLDAAGGVMRFLEERKIGFDVGVTVVPLVCQSCIFDLTVADKNCRPDADMAYKACEAAFSGEKLVQGCVGAGTGASVGKLYGMDRAMKSGIGFYAVELNGLKVGAAAVVNALGDVYENKERIAGLLNEDKTGLSDTREEMYKNTVIAENLFTGNTTICCVVTNADFDKAQAGKVASMAQNGLVRAIDPVNTTADGDSVYAICTGKVRADINVTGTLAAQVLEKAVINAVKNAEPMYGLKAYKDL
ncbi:MAG: P1 family peptidase [Firmicutes bacterium]|nr:P1 family peptidase [Bacillota bacterium]